MAKKNNSGKSTGNIRKNAPEKFGAELPNRESKPKGGSDSGSKGKK